MLMIDESSVFCRVRQASSANLRNFRARNRLYLRSDIDGCLYLVPDSMGSGAIQRRVSIGRIYLLTNGIY